jgi:hypothetical protein
MPRWVNSAATSCVAGSPRHDRALLSGAGAVQSGAAALHAHDQSQPCICRQHIHAAQVSRQQQVCRMFSNCLSQQQWCVPAGLAHVQVLDGRLPILCAGVSACCAAASRDPPLRSTPGVCNPQTCNRQVLCAGVTVSSSSSSACTIASTRCPAALAQMEVEACPRTQMYESCSMPLVLLDVGSGISVLGQVCDGGRLRPSQVPVEDASGMQWCRATRQRRRSFKRNLATEKRTEAASNGRAVERT